MAYILTPMTVRVSTIALTASNTNSNAALGRCSTLTIKSATGQTLPYVRIIQLVHLATVHKDRAIMEVRQSITSTPVMLQESLKPTVSRITALITRKTIKENLILLEHSTWANELGALKIQFCFHV